MLTDNWHSECDKQPWAISAWYPHKRQPHESSKNAEGDTIAHSVGEAEYIALDESERDEMRSHLRVKRPASLPFPHPGNGRPSTSDIHPKWIG